MLNVSLDVIVVDVAIVTLLFYDVGYFIQLDDVIDLVVPRGSNKLVSQIKESTKIPVLGHAGKFMNF